MGWLLGFVAVAAVAIGYRAKAGVAMSPTISDDQVRIVLDWQARDITRVQLKASLVTSIY